jgi:cold shock CspA family protein
MIRRTFGKVLKYNIEKGFGFTAIADDKWATAFFSHRNVNREGVDGTLKIKQDDMIEFDLCLNEKGYYADNVKFLDEDAYNIKTLELSENKYNR